MAFWPDLSAVPPDTLGTARRQAHQAVQWVARAARHAVPPKDDDSHSSLGWDDERGALVTHEMPSGVTLGLRIADLSLLKLSEQGAELFPLDRLGDADANTWVREAIGASGLDWPPELPYAHELEILEGGYDLSATRDALETLADWYKAAHSVLEDAHEKWSGFDPGPSDVRCWPHHFDIATLVSLAQGDAETAPAIGVGMSPGDGAYGEPYFYVNPWPHLDPDALPDPPTPGHWHTEGFVGAILTGSEFLAAGGGRPALMGFLTEAFDTGRDILTKSE